MWTVLFGKVFDAWFEEQEEALQEKSLPILSTSGRTDLCCLGLMQIRSRIATQEYERTSYSIRWKAGTRFFRV